MIDINVKKALGAIEKAAESSGRTLMSSSIVLTDAMGFPVRVLAGNGNEGEPSGMDEAYDLACDLLGAGRCEVSREDGFVWFHRPASEAADSRLSVT